jgi:DNA-binding NarL/FixJ family response regulator
MIVDDHAAYRSALRNWIAGLHAGCEVVEAGSGEEAIALASKREVRVVLMDLELPGMSGMEATRRINVCMRDAYLLKEVVVKEVLAAVRTVHGGGRYLRTA